MLFITEIIIWYLLLLLATRMAGRDGLMAFVVGAAIIANVETIQFVDVFGVRIPGGSIPFACLFLATDVSSEIYGRLFSRKLVLFSGLAMCLSSFIFALFGMNGGVSTSYHETLDSTVRIALASLVVYYICGQIDVRLYHVIGKATRYKWLRNNIATISAQLVNAFLFILLAFGWIGFEPIIGNWMISLLLALVDTPMIYLLTGHDDYLED